MPGLRALSFYTIFHCEYPLLAPRCRRAATVLPRVSLHDVCSLSPSFPFSPPILMGILFTRRRVHDEKSKVRAYIRRKPGRPIGYRRKILRIDATARRPFLCHRIDVRAVIRERGTEQSLSRFRPSPSVSFLEFFGFGRSRHTLTARLTLKIRA